MSNKVLSKKKADLLAYLGAFLMVVGVFIFIIGLIELIVLPEVPAKMILIFSGLALFISGSSIFLRSMPCSPKELGEKGKALYSFLSCYGVERESAWWLDIPENVRYSEEVIDELWKFRSIFSRMLDVPFNEKDNSSIWPIYYEKFVYPALYNGSYIVSHRRRH